MMPTIGVVHTFKGSSLNIHSSGQKSRLCKPVLLSVVSLLSEVIVFNPVGKDSIKASLQKHSIVLTTAASLFLSCPFRVQEAQVSGLSCTILVLFFLKRREDFL